ncbi:DUF1961 family protein [Kineococcus sp. G2]|uniref:DUF1961 family protein n=1 Tax=Kineococcus sp. G2 TaxID=3127484 RepID=UPI00301BA40D
MSTTTTTTTTTTAAADTAYRNPLRSAGDLAGWVGEGPVVTEPGPDGTVLASSATDPDADSSHFTLWCPRVFGDSVRVSVGFTPLSGEGLAMLFVGAAGTGGQDLFSPDLAVRSGLYPQYHSSDVRALHVSFYRRKWASERRFLTCNLRKAPGFHLVAQGADPLPPHEDADGPYRLQLVKDGPHVSFSIDGLELLRWTDDGSTGPAVGGGRVGFRQMAPLRARWSDLEVEQA